ncbi:MAG TPA: tetratricopeptide repeat protein [Methylomirabilota bacterium]|nr:tetratricopeptide repeat protein [Methylomirabilota bacterium]
MSRFGNLEFDDPSRQNAGHGESRRLKDDAFYLEEAAKAFKQGRFEPALRNFAKAIEFNPRHSAPWAGQVRMLLELGEAKEAKIWADKALKLFPTDPELLAAKGVALARMGDQNGALAFSDASMAASGETPYLWLARGDVFLARKEKRADYCFERALALSPGDWVIRWLASRIHSAHQQFAKALRYAQESLALTATEAAVWLQAGQCQLALGLIDASERSFQQAQELDPQCAAAARELQKLNHVGPLARLISRFRGKF